MIRSLFASLVGGLVLAAAPNALAGTMVFIDSAVLAQIQGLTITPGGDYTAVNGSGATLVLPDTGFNMGGGLTHDGGNFTFGSNETASNFFYSQWVYDFPSNFVTLTNENIPFKLTNVDMNAGTATLTFATSGAIQWDALAGGNTFSENDVFGTTTFVPEPSTALLLAGGLLALAGARPGRRRWVQFCVPAGLR